jgi:hypothetical protein
MSPLLVLFTLAVYGLAGYLLWRERSYGYVLALFAGHLAMLLTPVWQRAYAVTTVSEGGLSLFGRYDVPWALLLGGGAILALPAIAFRYGLRNRWWPRHYAIIWAGYAVFVVYFALVEAILERTGSPFFTSTLLLRDTVIPGSLAQALLLAGVSLGILYTMVSTRHYALQVAIVPLLFSGVAASILFLGIFASPLWVAGLLDQDGWIMTAAALVSLALVLWGVHLLANGLHSSRLQQLVWR